MRLYQVAACVLAGLSAGGCAFSDVRLDPPPHQKVTTTREVGRGREILLVVPFADRRAQRSRCGMKKNGYNMDTADIRCSTPPNRWLAQLLGEELRAAGFQVSTDPAKAGPGALHLEGELAFFFVEPKVGAFTYTPEADIELRLVATDRAGLRADRRIYVKGVEPSVFGTEENFRLAAEAAVRQMLSRAVDAVAELVQKYPHVGLPHVASSSSRTRAAEVLR